VPPDAAIYPIPSLGFVNLRNGNLHIEIPIRVVKDRNGAPLTSSLTYDSSVWELFPEQSESGGTTYAWGVSNAVMNTWSSSLGVSSSPNYLTHTVFQEINYPCGNSYALQYSNWQFIDGHGTIHAFPPELLTEQGGITGCPDISGIQAAAIDGSGYWLQVTNYNNAVVYDMHGNIVTGGGLDTNGNFAPPIGNDKLGRSISLPSGFTLSRETVNVWTEFGAGGASELGPVSGDALSSITLPDGRTYSFQYDDAGNPAKQGHYGSLTGITLPTGGQISIVNEVVPDAGANLNTALVVKQITTPDGTWSFSYAPEVVNGVVVSPGMVTATAPVDPVTNLAAQTTWSTSQYQTTQTVSVYSGSAMGASRLPGSPATSLPPWKTGRLARSPTPMRMSVLPESSPKRSMTSQAACARDGCELLHKRL
jgi:YD repeat-containing protein